MEIYFTLDTDNNSILVQNDVMLIYSVDSMQRVVCPPLDHMLFQLLAGSGSQAKKRDSLQSGLKSLGSQYIPCLGQRHVKLYTLFRTARPKTHTLSSGTSLYSSNKGVPPPPRGFLPPSSSMLKQDPVKIFPG